MNEQFEHHHPQHNDPHFFHKHHLWYGSLGILLIMLGFLEIAFASLSTLFSVLYIGFFFIFLGIIEAIQAIRLRGMRSFLLHALLSALYLIAGIYTIMDPMGSAVTLTLLIAIAFFIAGAMKIAIALFSHVVHQGWILFDGIISLILGILLWQEWPGNSIWVIGVLVGVKTISTGIAWMLGSRAFTPNNSKL